MATIEKTVFISYRRTDQYKALLVYQALASKGYDVFLDYTSLHSGEFEHIIISNIRARAYFVLILTPTALDRCNEPEDWLRREIEIAIDEKRNIVPLFFDDFSFSSPSVVKRLTGKMARVKGYNGLEIPTGFFTEAMDKLSSNFLNDPTNAVIHPVSNEVRRVVKEEKHAANKAIAEKEKVLSLGNRKKRKFRSYGIGAGIFLMASLCVFGAFSLIRNYGVGIASTSTPIDRLHLTATVETLSASTIVPTSSASSIPPTPASTVSDDKDSPKDGMTLILVPAGEFQMGSRGNDPDERPVHSVYVDNYRIDRTEITNAMYALCVEDRSCEPPRANISMTQNESNNSFYYGNPAFDDYPVIYVSWYDAKSYCSWAGRRLPTEAEWEKAASWDDDQQTKRIYPWGNDIDCSYANYWGDGDKLCVGDTTPVGNYPNGASFFGVLDMAGNVFEWVLDRYDPEYYNDPEYNNPTGPISGDNIVTRGGSFLIGKDNATRSSDREFQKPDYTSQSIGFRCAMDAE